MIIRNTGYTTLAGPAPKSLVDVLIYTPFHTGDLDFSRITGPARSSER